jgi:hypothetical protein
MNKKKSDADKAGSNSKVARYVKRKRVIDNPKYDSRTKSSPYFVHSPYLVGKMPPYTLRRGGYKNAPTICLINGSFLWRKWKLEFSDELAREGVVDGRGVMSMAYGTKKGKDGTIRGYSFRNRRWWYETGKEWHKEEKKRRRELRNTSPDKPSTPLRPEEVVQLRWTAPLSPKTRQYDFVWRGITFIWKGTATVMDTKLVGQILGYNHLKLVALVPITGNADTKKTFELCLSKYTCLMAHRKAGRLEVFNDVVERFLERYVLGECDAGSSNQSDGGTDTFHKMRQRFNDVLVASATCMIIAEGQKRDVLKEIILLILEVATQGNW